MNNFAIPLWIKTGILGLGMFGALGGMVYVFQTQPGTETNSNSENETARQAEVLYDVISVVDGDTIKINYNGNTTSVRLIGVNTPETVDPRTTVECFGTEASNYLKEMLEGTKVSLEIDNTQTDRDKYDRLLRYVYLDGKDVGLDIITNGYGYEYTYDVPYSKQTDYKAAQKTAENNKKGLWADGVCVESQSESSNDSQQTTTSPTPSTTATPTNTNNADNCVIKGNISYSGERIYHVPGQQYYDETKIDTSAGERWFCSEEEALAAGWRKSKV